MWDLYYPFSIKGQAREGRGQRVRRASDKTVIPRNWPEFLRNSENKQELFKYLSEKISNMDVKGKQLYTTCHDKVLTAHQCDKQNITALKPCNQEDVDTRMLPHAARAASEGHKKMLIRTVDTDVVVLAIAHMQRL